MKLQIKQINKCRWNYNNCHDVDCEHRYNHTINSRCSHTCSCLQDDNPCCHLVEEKREVTFIERYKELNNPVKNFGTLWWIWHTCVEFYRQIFKNVRTIIYSEIIYTGYCMPAKSISDGYWLVLLSPIVLVYWLGITAMSIILTIFPVLPMLILLGLCDVLYLPCGIWALLIESVASIINKNE